MIVVLKLLVAPVITLWLCMLMGVPQDVTAVMVVAAATPVGVLITIFAAELKAEPEFISTATVITTRAFATHGHCVDHRVAVVVMPRDTAVCTSGLR